MHHTKYNVNVELCQKMTVATYRVGMFLFGRNFYSAHGANEKFLTASLKVS